MTGFAYIQWLLAASAAVRDSLSSWKYLTNEYWFIFYSWVIPEIHATSYKIKKADADTTTLINGGILKPTVQFKTINYYRDSSIDGLLPHVQTSYTINCRAYIQSDAEAIATAVFNALNKNTTASVNIYCQQEPVIPPRDEQDNYNARITAFVKSKE
jgi:hypothetical protein